MAAQPLIWLCNTSDIRIQDGSPHTLRVTCDKQYRNSNEVTYHIWNNIRGTIIREDLVGCFATIYDTKATGDSFEMGIDEDVIRNGWFEIKCPTYEDKWYTAIGDSVNCPIGANGTDTISGSVNTGNFDTDIANRAIIVVRVRGYYNLDIVSPGTKSFKLVVGGSY